MHGVRLIRSVAVLCVVVAAELVAALPASAQADLRARCSQLNSYYARYGTTRSADRDGNRNLTRIGAEIDCQNGRFEEGIAALEALMRGKNWTVPPRQ